MLLLQNEILVLKNMKGALLKERKRLLVEVVIFCDIPIGDKKTGRN